MSAGSDSPSSSPEPPDPSLRERLIRSGMALRERIASDSRLRGEVAWVLAYKVGEFALIFASLKVLTTLLGKEAYGEYSLVMTALMLLSNALIAPMNRTYLRQYHGAEAQEQARSAGLTMLAWYAVVTVSIALGACLLTPTMSRVFDLGLWTTLAAGIVFLGNRFRVLGIEVLNIQRRRRPYAIQGLGFQILQLALIVMFIQIWDASPAAALFATAAAALTFGAIAGVPLLRRTLSQPRGRPSHLMRMVLTFGAPYGATLVFQWLQLFSDRYILKVLLDFDAAGAYVAAYQVCGAPFMLVLGVLDLLILPIAYQRARDVHSAGQLWQADKVILGGVAVYLALGALAIPVFVLWGPNLVVLLTSSEFALGSGTVLFLALGRYIQCLTLMLQMFFAVHQKMGRLLGFRLVGAMLTIPICWVMIRDYDIFGASLGMLIAMSVYTLLLVLAPGGVFWLVRTNRMQHRKAA